MCACVFILFLFLFFLFLLLLFIFSFIFVFFHRIPLCSSTYPGTYRDPPAFAHQVQGLKVCTTTTSFFSFYSWINFLTSSSSYVSASNRLEKVELTKRPSVLSWCLHSGHIVGAPFSFKFAYHVEEFPAFALKQRTTQAICREANQDSQRPVWQITGKIKITSQCQGLPGAWVCQDHI